MARYINKKTGAVVDSPFVLKGKNWEIEGQDTDIDEKEKETVEVSTKEKETAEFPKDLTDLRVDELKALADKNKISYTSKDTKNDLIELIAAELN